MNNPKVSVLMPLYNTDKDVLIQSIGSILSQTYDNFEFLILNDSPQNTELKDVVASFKDTRIIYSENKENLGLEASTNKLIAIAKGEYIAIFDHDDISEHTRLEKQVEYLDKNPDYGMVSAQFQVFGNEEWVSENPTEDADIKQKLTQVSCVSHTTMMVRKSVIEKNNLKYEKEFFPASSYRMITRIALVTRVHNLPDVLLRYRLDGNNTSVKHDALRVEKRNLVKQDYIEELKKNDLIEEYQFSSIKLLSRLKDGRRYYKAKKDNRDTFVKTGVSSFENEYLMSKRMYEKNSELFIKPIAFVDGPVGSIVMEWCEGPTLEEHFESGVLDAKIKETLFDSLANIFTSLYEEGIVHRDIIPRNFIVVKNKLVLIDLNYAVDYKEYYTESHYKEDLVFLGMLGESYAAGVYRWDDAFSVSKIAQEVIGIAPKNPRLQEIISIIGKRVIIPTGESFRGELVDKYTTINKLQEELAKKNEDVNRLNASLDSCVAELSRIAAEIENLRGSKSYRLAHRASVLVGKIKQTTKPLKQEP